MKMKKLILLSLVLISGKCFSQTAHHGLMQEIGSRLSFGIKAGGNYSNYYNAGFKTDPLAGFYAGATVSLRLGKHISVVEDFLYSQEGAKNKSTFFGGDDIKVSYLSVPILIRYKTNSGLYVEGGMQASMKLNEQVSGLSTGHFAGTVNAGVAGGIGYQSKMGLGISARYIYGLTKVGDLSGKTIDNNFKSGTAQLGLFYNF